MTEHLVELEGERLRVVALISRRPLPFRVTVKDGRHRSIDQNKLLWKWIGEAAAQRQDVTAQDVAAEWKIQFGVPILCAEDDSFAAMWLVAERKLTYEEQIELMRFVSVSSLMNVTQLKRYLDLVYQHNTERGIELTNPEDLKWGKP